MVLGSDDAGGEVGEARAPQEGRQWVGGIGVAELQVAVSAYEQGAGSARCPVRARRTARKIFSACRVCRKRRLCFGDERRQIWASGPGLLIESACVCLTEKIERGQRHPALRNDVYNYVFLSISYGKDVRRSWLW